MVGQLTRSTGPLTGRRITSQPATAPKSSATTATITPIRSCEGGTPSRRDARAVREARGMVSLWLTTRSRTEASAGG